MPNVIALVKEDRVRRQVESFLGELGYDNLQVSLYKTSQEFEQIYLKENRDPETAKFDQIHMIIFAIDAIDAKVGAWLEKTRKELARFNLFTRGMGVKMILVKYEEDNLSISDVLHPKLDDLIFAPLDRLLFLQKIDIFLNLPRTVKPRFLFSQDANLPIEISKIVKLDRLGDVGLAIRNPIPLKRGVSAHFYMQIPGEKSYLSVYGKVVRTEPHPDFPNQYLVYFNYIGLKRQDLSKIRGWLSKSPSYKSLVDDDPEAFRFDDRNIFLTEDQRRRLNIVVLDADEKNGAAIRAVLTKDIDRINSIYENSYSLFLHKYFKPQARAAVPLPRPSQPEELYITPLQFTVDAATRQMIQVERMPEVEDKIIGRLASELFSTPEGWLELFSKYKESLIVIDESLFLARQGRRVRKIITAQGGMNEPVGLALNFVQASEETHVQVTIEIASAAEIGESSFTPETPPTLDVLIIDSAFVPHDVSTWTNTLKRRAFAAKLIPHEDDLRIIITTNKEVDPPAKWLNQPEIVGIFHKPVDVRQFCFTLSETLKNSCTPFHFGNLTWAQPNIFVHVAKESDLESLSEFGVTLKSDRPIAPGNIVYLRKSIYENAPNNCLAARIYSTQEHPSEPGRYQCLATYFGINDNFLKFARTWIRENYANLKKSVMT